MRRFDNSIANFGLVAFFIIGFFMIGVVVVAITAQGSLRGTTPAYSTPDSFGGFAQNNSTASAANVSAAMTTPSLGFGVLILLLIACLAVIAAIAAISRLR